MAESLTMNIDNNLRLIGNTKDKKKCYTDSSIMKLSYHYNARACFMRITKSDLKPKWIY